MSSATPPSHSKASSSYRRQQQQPQQRYVRKSTSTPNPSPPPPLTTTLRSSASSGGSSGGGVGGSSSSAGGGCGGSGGFVAYLPHDEAVAAGLGGLDAVESQAVVDLLNDALAALLRAKPRDFWRQVAQNGSLHEFLDSYLQFRHRWYDLPHRGPKGTVAGVVVGELELCRRVFMVLYRISSNKDPGAARGDSLSSKEHAVLLQEIKLLDLPKLLDICAIYGHDNGKLTSSLVTNAINVQPKVLDGVNAVISQFLSIVHTMHDRCMSSLQVLSSSGPNEHGYGQLHTDYLEVLDFINDAVVTLDAFVDAYQPAALLFSTTYEMSYGVEELLNALARLHDSLLPSLLQGFKVISRTLVSNAETSSGSKLSDIVLGIRMLSKRIVGFGWRLLEFCYLNDQLTEHDVQASNKMFPAKVEDSMIRGEILVQTLKDINGEATYTFHDNSGRTFLQAVEKEFKLMSWIDSLRSKGWMDMDDEQFLFLCQLTASTLLTSRHKEPDLPISSHGGEIQLKDEEAAITESKISQIRDLFPDYGKGFLSACLEAYNHNPEEVIQRILDGTLHQDLLALDTSLEQMPQHKPEPTSGKDKGKGILVEPAPLTLNKTHKVDSKMPHRIGDGPSSLPISSVSHSPSLSSISTVPQGRFTRKTDDELADSVTLDSEQAKDAVRSAVLESQYEYEDEYDDSFDDLGFSIVESSYEEAEGSNDAEASSNGSRPQWSSQKKTQFYVKDGKNYSYKVAGAVAVSSAREAAVLHHTQKGMIHGLGAGGNVPMGGPNMKRADMGEEKGGQTPSARDSSGRGASNFRGRGGRRGGSNHGSPPEEEGEDTNDAQNFGRGGPSARGGGGGRRGGRNHYRKDRAMKKHMQGMGGS